ncbi:MAG: rhomboid family intramembrane serine protease [Candidatus Sumerlaeia bacterium]|nr:rhomboid family intramembrane serine protease [Candidatus Sumerlaeia bacterium]
MILFPYRNENPWTRTPFATFALIVLNVLAFAVEMWVLDERGPNALSSLVFRPGVTAWPTLFTSMFLHAGVAHLAMNMWFLYLIGGQVEEEMGSIGFLAFYLIGGLCANLSHVLFCILVGDSVGVLGASGAIYAVMGAYFILYPYEEFSFWYFVLFRCGTVKIATLFFVAYKVLGDAIMAWATVSYKMVGSVANWSHLGGLFFGIGVAAGLYGGGAFVGKERPSKEQRERLRRLRRVARRKLYSDAPLPTPMTEAEIALATDDMTPEEGIRRGIFFHNGRMLEWAFQEMLFKNPKACLDPDTQLKLVEMLRVHGRDSYAQIAARNLIEAHPQSPAAIQARFILGHMLASVPWMKNEAVRLLKEFLSFGVAYREQIEAEKLLRRLEDRPLWDWKGRSRP